MEHKYDYQRVICGVKQDKITPAMKIDNSMSCFKRSMLPEKRSMYESLYKQSLNRFALSGNAPGQLVQNPSPSQIAIVDQENPGSLVDHQENVV